MAGVQPKRKFDEARKKGKTHQALPSYLFQSLMLFWAK